MSKIMIRVSHKCCTFFVFVFEFWGWLISFRGIICLFVFFLVFLIFLLDHFIFILYLNFYFWHFCLNRYCCLFRFFHTSSQFRFWRLQLFRKHRSMSTKMVNVSTSVETTDTLNWLQVACVILHHYKLTELSTKASISVPDMSFLLKSLAFFLFFFTSKHKQFIIVHYMDIKPHYQSFIKHLKTVYMAHKFIYWPKNIINSASF